MHVMFGTPPFGWKSTNEGGLNSAEHVESRVAVVDCGVSNPSNKYLSEGKAYNT
jgi:hypothetical protein